MRLLRASLSWRTGLAILAAAWALGAPSEARAVTLTVCASGCTHTTIQAAHNAAAGGDTIEVQDAVHTELGITITKSVTIQGLGATATIVQAAATPGTAADRVFFIPGNAGGPISVTLRRMTIRHGKAAVLGGGVLASGEAGNVDLRVENTILSKNQAAVVGGAIYLGGLVGSPVNLTIVDSTIDENTARNFSAVNTPDNGAFTMTGSTISNNVVSPTSLSSALELGVGFTIANSTVSGNTGSDGILVTADGSIINTTVTGNEFIGLRRLVGTLTVSNSIVADNGTDCVGTLTIPAGAPNLDGDGTCTGFTIQNGDADLGPLQNNGGPTQTHAIGLASDGLNAGDDAICAATPVDGVDQRGFARPLGTHCDLGAFEHQNHPPDCSAAEANPDDVILPLLITFVPVAVDGVTDPDGDSVSITITSIRQDEPVGLLHPDGTGVGTPTALVRTEANLLGNGRVHHIGFTASDGQGGTCNGTVKTGVRLLFPAVDGGPIYDSTL